MAQHGRISTGQFTAAAILSAAFFWFLAPAAFAEEADSRDALYEEIAQEVALLEQRGNILKKVVKVATPSVVHIESTFMKPLRYGQRTPETDEEAGSGTIIEIGSKYYVLTNRHVLRGADPGNILVRTHQGRRLTVTRVWAHRETDVAVISLAETGLPTARIGDSDDVEIGDFALAVGSPFGLSHSVTYGIISAKGRRDLALGNDDLQYQDFLQTDAAINPGNSGGPLLNLRGEVIGINTAIASNSGGNEGIGFAIPANMVMAVAKQLVARGEVAHAYLGVKLYDNFGPLLISELGLPTSKGALVKGITPESPASRARLMTHDLIIRYNGTSVDDDSHLVNLVGLTPAGNVIKIALVRKGQPMELNVRLGARRDFEEEE